MYKNMNVSKTPIENPYPLYQTYTPNVILKKANLRDLVAVTGQVILLKLDSKPSVIWPVLPWNLMDDLDIK